MFIQNKCMTDAVVVRETLFDLVVDTILRDVELAIEQVC